MDTISICPAIASVAVCAPPRYGTWTNQRRLQPKHFDCDVKRAADTAVP